MIGQWYWQDLEETSSTNDDAINFSKNSAYKKFVITAKSQSKGRGRRGRNWIGLDGNLFMSMAIPVDMKDLGQIIFVVGLSLAKTIKSISPSTNVEIKWPNDVLVNSKKISGILLEKGEHDFLVIGIGVNVKASPKVDGLIYPTTSLIEEGIDIDRIEFMHKYLQRFDEYYDVWQNEGFAKIKEAWLSMAKAVGQKIYVNCDDGIKEGIFSGVDDNGLLLIQNHGKDIKIFAGDVFFNKG